jgi:hypothetical protein
VCLVTRRTCSAPDIRTNPAAKQERFSRIFGRAAREARLPQVGLTYTFAYFQR